MLPDPRTARVPGRKEGHPRKQQQLISTLPARRSFASILALLKLNAVVGVTGSFNPGGKADSYGRSPELAREILQTRARRSPRTPAYWHRSAVIGSTRSARHAGSADERNATATTNTAAPA